MTNKYDPGFRGRKREITANYPILPRNTPQNQVTLLTYHLPGVCLTPKCFPAWSEARGLKSARLSPRMGDISCGRPLEALSTRYSSREAREVGHYRYRFAAKRRGEEEVGSILFLAVRLFPDIGRSGFVIDYYTGRLLHSLSLILGSLSPSIAPTCHLEMGRV